MKQLTLSTRISAIFIDLTLISIGFYMKNIQMSSFENQNLSFFLCNLNSFCHIRLLFLEYRQKGIEIAWYSSCNLSNCLCKFGYILQIYYNILGSCMISFSIYIKCSTSQLLKLEAGIQEWIESFNRNSLIFKLMYCIRKHLLFDRSYIIQLKQDSIDIGESTQKIKYVIPMNAQTVIDWKVNEENLKLVAFAIIWNGEKRHFYADQNVLLRVKEYMDGKVIYNNMDLFFEAIKKPDSKQQSSIQLIKRIDGEQVFALKELKKLKKNSQQLFQNEVESLRQLNHKNIVKLIQIFESDCTYQIVLQYLKGGSLGQCLKYCKLNSQEVIIIIQQILEGINFIHKKEFVHRDIKPENILFYDLGQFSQLYIIDFGSAKKLQDLDKDKDMKFGTPGYMAPEIFDNSQKVSEKVDIFACGAILYQMLTGLKLITGTTQKEIMENNKNFTVTNQILSKIKSNDYQNLVAQMLEENPQNRISASEALNYLNLMKIQTFTGSLSIQIHHHQEPVQKLPNFKKLINKQ